jgi:hypothetical protein
MEDIVEPTISHDFSSLCLGPPTTVAGGSYFTRIMHKNNKPLYVQTPKCFSKQGFVKSGKRIYADLMFDNNDTIFIDWIERLEAKCQELVYVKGDKWFQTKLEKDDIETAFTSPLKVYKSGKFYLLRVNVKPNIKIYNESDKIVNLEEIVETNSLISILEIQGIKFTSRNFQIEIDLKQSLVVSPDPFLDACFIKKPIKPVQKNIVIAADELKEHEIFDLNEEPKIEVTVSEVFKELEPVAKIEELESFLSLEEFDFDEDFDAKTLANTVANSSNTIPETKPDTILEIIPDTILETIPDTIIKDSAKDETIIKDSANITLDIKDLNPTFLLEEFAMPLIDTNDLETLTLKKPNQVYHEIYQKAREKAKAAKKEAMLAYLEVKNIKKTYMLDNMDDSDSELESVSDVEL